MTITEAVSLVLQAFAVGSHGDILVLDMGRPVRIADLARSLMRLAGKSEDDVKIVFTGLRPGEKLTEQLFYEDEQIMATSHPKISRTAGSVMGWTDLMLCLNELEQALLNAAPAEIVSALKRIVPEWNVDPSAYEFDQIQEEPSGKEALA